MTLTLDPSLQKAIDALSLQGIIIGHRAISPGDEHALMPEEAAAFATSVVVVRRASGSARVVARQLLAQFGLPRCALPKSSSGAPIWPNGIVGSMSHNSCVAVAAVAMRRDFCALGIDVEPGEDLASDLLDLVATPQERAEIGEHLSTKDGCYLPQKKPSTRQSIHSIKLFLITTTYRSVSVIVGPSCATVKSSNCSFAFQSIWWLWRS